MIEISIRIWKSFELDSTSDEEIQAQMERLGTDNYFSAMDFLYSDLTAMKKSLVAKQEPLTMLVTIMGRLKVNVQGNQVQIFKDKLNRCRTMPFDESAVVVLEDIYEQPVSRERSARNAISAGLRCALQGSSSWVQFF